MQNSTTKVGLVGWCARTTAGLGHGSAKKGGTQPSHGKQIASGGGDTSLLRFPGRRGGCLAELPVAGAWTSCPPFVIHATNTKPAARTDTKWLRMIQQRIHSIKRERGRKDSKPNEASQPDVVYAVHLSNNRCVSKDPSPTLQTSKKAETHKAARSA